MSVREFLQACESEEVYTVIPYRILRDGAQTPRRAHAMGGADPLTVIAGGPGDSRDEFTGFELTTAR